MVHGTKCGREKKILDHKIYICTQKIMSKITKNNCWEFCDLIPLTGSLHGTFFTSRFHGLADLGNLMVLLCDTCFQENLLFLLFCTALSPLNRLRWNLEFQCSKQKQGNNMLYRWSTRDDHSCVGGWKGEELPPSVFAVPISGSF